LPNLKDLKLILINLSDYKASCEISTKNNSAFFLREVLILSPRIDVDFHTWRLSPPPHARPGPRTPSFALNLFVLITASNTQNRSTRAFFELEEARSRMAAFDPPKDSILHENKAQACTGPLCMKIKFERRFVIPNVSSPFLELRQDDYVVLRVLEKKERIWVKSEKSTLTPPCLGFWGKWGKGQIVNRKIHIFIMDSLQLANTDT